METNLQESADCFKLTNEIPNVWGNINICEKCLFCINFICLMTILRGTNDARFRHLISEKEYALDTRLVS